LHDQPAAGSSAPVPPALGGGFARLSDLIAGDEPLPLEAVTAVLAGLAAALPARGITPGGLVPEAVLLDASGNVFLAPPPPLKEADAYLAPEQRDGGPAAAASDEYALAMIAYELLTGTSRATQMDVGGFVTISDIDVGPAHVLRPGLPLTVNAAIKRATLRDPSARHGSAAAFVDALGRALRGEVGARQGPALVAPPRASRPELRHRGTALGTVVARMGMAAGVVGLLVGVTWLSSSLGGVWQAIGNRGGPGRTLALPGDSGQVTRSTGDSPTPGGPPASVALPGATRAGAPASEAAGFVRVDVVGGTPTVLLDGRPVGRAPLLVRADPGLRTVTVRDGTRRFTPATRAVLVAVGDTSGAAFQAVLP
jgi:hypothetical protein